MILTKGNKNKVSENFTENEFFSKSSDIGNTHYFDENLILAAQLLRTHFNTPMRVNSSYRTIKHNNSVGGAKSSQHLLGTAVDLSFINNENALLTVHQEILNKGALYDRLKQLGINGFGLYDTFVHLDTRRNNAFWDKRVVTKKKRPA